MVFDMARSFGLSLAGRRVRRMLLVVGLAFAVVPAGSALADPTVGQTGGGISCFSARGAVLADTNYVVPAGGVITSFSFQSDSSNAGQQLDFLVLGPESASSYSVVGKTGLVTLAGTGLETFSANIFVQSGDILGFWTNASALRNCAHFASGGGLKGAVMATDPNVGDTVTLPQVGPGLDANVSATLASADQLVNDIIGLAPGTALRDKATAIQAAVNAGDMATACADITDFVGLVKAQTGKKLSPANVTTLTNDANSLAAALGC